MDYPTKRRVFLGFSAAALVAVPAISFLPSCWIPTILPQPSEPQPWEPPADPQPSYIVVHALNPEGIEINTIEGMDEDGRPGPIAYDGDDSLGFAPIKPPKEISPGAHTISVAFNGIKLERAIDIPEGQTQVLVFIFRRTDCDIAGILDNANLSRGISAEGSWGLLGGVGIDGREYDKHEWNDDCFCLEISGSARTGDTTSTSHGSFSGSVSYTLNSSLFALNMECELTEAGTGMFHGAGVEVSFRGKFNEVSKPVSIGIESSDVFTNWFVQYNLRGSYPWARLNDNFNRLALDTPTPDQWSEPFRGYPLVVGEDTYLRGKEGLHLHTVPASVNYYSLAFGMQCADCTADDYGSSGSMRVSASQGNAFDRYSYASGPLSVSGSLTGLSMASVPYDLAGTGVRYEEGRPPVASFTATPSTGRALVRQPMTFDASSSHDADGEIVHYHWRFGDGESVVNDHETTEVVHTYTEPGEYKVKLSVTDDDGYMNSTTLTVQASSPVLLVHGWHGSRNNWALFERWLGKDGYDPYVLEYDDSACASAGAVELSARVDKILEPYGQLGDDGRKLDIIAHSFGGLVSRYYVESMGGDRNVDHLIMLATPNHGTRLADYLTGQMNDGDAASVVEVILGLYSGLRPDRAWCSSSNLRTKNNDFLDTLNLHFRLDRIDTQYFVIAGTGHYPKNYTSSASFLPGPDDGVVALSSARLVGVPLYCVELDHSSIVNPYNVKERTSEELSAREEVLRCLYDDTIKPILRDVSPSAAYPCPWDDPDDSQPLINGAATFSIQLKQGSSAADGFDVTAGVSRVEVGFRFEFCDFEFALTTPSQGTITPSVAQEDPNVDYVQYDGLWRYTVNNPESGRWEWYIKALELPEDGEDITVYALW